MFIVALYWAARARCCKDTCVAHTRILQQMCVLTVRTKTKAMQMDEPTMWCISSWDDRCFPGGDSAKAGRGTCCNTFEFDWSQQTWLGYLDIVSIGIL